MNLFKKKSEKKIIITTHLDAEVVRWPRTKLFLSLLSLAIQNPFIQPGVF